MSARSVDTEVLRAAGRTPPAPCAITLDDGSVCTLTGWLRILPGKRLTGLGAWKGHTVIVKLFLAATGSERHWQRECDGIARLQSAQLPTPEVLGTGRLAQDGQYLLTHYIEDARSPTVDDEADLLTTFRLLGRLHGSGLIQADAHLGNFLLAPGAAMIIDGDAIQQSEDATSRLNNLALLCAQLPPLREAGLRSALLAAYQEGNTQAAIDMAQLDAAIQLARTRRRDDYLRKCLRNCSLFHVEKRWDRFIATPRTEADFLAPLIANLDGCMKSGRPLKQGRTATLALVEHGGRQLVIKRYNIKGAGHAVSRSWRPSRAWHSWIAAHRLEFLGIATPRPLALVEQRFGPLRSRAWLVTEYCPGPSLTEYCRDRLDTPPTDIIESLANLFSALAAARISHGDLKATNLLWHTGRIFLLDLDAMRQHTRPTDFARAWRKDRERLLRNWQADSALHAALSAALPGD